MELPAFLTTEISKGNVVLMLGAGASKEAVDAHGNHPPDGKQLAKKLADQFLGGAFADSPLNQVSEYAINESDLTTVQQFIADLYQPFLPAKSHSLLATFRWRGIATTNYDLIVERAYNDKTRGAAQLLVPFIENGDRVDDRLRDPNALAYLKLHGCITLTGNPEVPLILTTDQYVQYRQGRSRLFDRFKEWACERVLVFIGYRLQDPNLRAILLELDKDLRSRPRYYIVTPDFTDVESRFWETKRITAVSGTFGEFVAAIDVAVPATFRGLRMTTPAGEYAISERFVKPDSVISNSCRTFLAQDVDYVNAVKATEHVNPRDFYRGMSTPWSAIEQNLDVRRALSDTVLTDHFLVAQEEKEQEDIVKLIVIKAHAGAGKSVFLQRLAWEAAHDYGLLCLYVRPTGHLDASAVIDIARLCDERIYLFVDNVCPRATEVQRFLSTMEDAARRVTVVTTARINEWNVLGGTLPSRVSAEYELRYLSQREIEQLLALLERHKALHRLEPLSREERLAQLTERAGRQLLVALHEATLGKKFEEIVCDEYGNITPREAQEIYLTICALNRFDIPVRAGIISRLYGVSFEHFKDRFFKPLEEVVQPIEDPIAKDFAYVARHSHIAEIVFEEILRRPDDRFREYVKCLEHLDIGYSTDRKAFNQLIRGRLLADLFPNHNHVVSLFRIAADRAGEDPVLLHQMALYEMHRHEGDLERAAALLERAAEKAPRNGSIQHSRGELALRNARDAKTPLVRKKCLDDAATICQSLKRRADDPTHAYHTLVKVDLYRLQAALEEEQDVSEERLEQMLRRVEESLAEGLQKAPGDSYLLTAEAELASFLSQRERAVQALAKAFKANPHNVYVALALARVHEERGQKKESRDVLRQALDAKPNDRKLHYRYGKLSMEIGDVTDEQLLYHFKRAYSSGDKNYDAQVLHARQVYLTDGNQAAKPFFREMKNAKLPLRIRSAIRYPLAATFKGRVNRMEVNHCLIQVDGSGDWIYAHEDNITGGLGHEILLSSRVSFRIGFSMFGPVAFDVRAENA